MALNSVHCGEVPLKNCSLTEALTSERTSRREAMKCESLA